MKGIKVLIMTLAITALTTFPVFAEWKQEGDGRWWYQNDDGGYPANQWMEIDGKQYYFGEDGYILSNAFSPDGRLIGSDGSEITYINNSYESILDYYSAKIMATTPKLVEEYKMESKQSSNGLMGLAEICNGKIYKLAEISNEGIGEMASLYFRSGSGQYAEYEQWALKIYDVYMNEAQKIYDAYLDSAK